MKTLSFFIFIITALCAWCPWLDSKQALTLIDTQVTEINTNNPDSCPLSINEKSLRKALFGYTIDVSYDCTKTDEIMGVAKTKNSVLITFYKGIIGMPKHRASPQ